LREEIRGEEKKGREDHVDNSFYMIDEWLPKKQTE